MIHRGVLSPLRRQHFRLVGEAACRHRRPVHHRNDAVNSEARADGRPVEGFHQGFGQGKPGRLDDDLVRRRIAGEQRFDGGNEIIRHRAAQAAVGKLDDIVFRAALDAAGFQYLAVNADIAELVDDKRQPAAARGLQHMADQRGFAGAQKAGDDGDRHFGELCHASVFSSCGSGGMRATTPFFNASGRSFQVMTPSGAAW